MNCPKIRRAASAVSSGAEWQAGLLDREPVDVAVQQRVGVGGQLDREARTAKTAEHRVMVGEGAGPGVTRDPIRPIAHRWRRRASRAEIARWRMAARQPTLPGGRPISLNTRSTIPSSRSFFSGDVAVQRHRLDPDRPQFGRSGYWIMDQR